MTDRYKVMCGCECLIPDKSINYSLLTLRDFNLEKLKEISHNALNKSSGEISSRIFEAYKNALRPHGFHI